MLFDPSFRLSWCVGLVALMHFRFRFMCRQKCKCTTNILAVSLSFIYKLHPVNHSRNICHYFEVQTEENHFLELQKGKNYYHHHLKQYKLDLMLKLID